MDLSEPKLFHAAVRLGTYPFSNLLYRQDIECEYAQELSPSNY